LHAAERIIRIVQAILIASTLLGSWLGMQAVHELGHVCGAWLTGGRVSQVVLHPLTISRTDLAVNPRPLIVVWAGPVFGVMAPLATWIVAAGVRLPGAFVLRFFAGFCLLANGLYIGVGSFDGVGDCGEMLRHGSAMWHLWLFGAMTAPLGLWLWHGQGPHFGLGSARGQVNPGAALGAFAAFLFLVALGLIVDGK
jgi:hypothetical protein